jgi:hypothetical protein
MALKLFRLTLHPGILCIQVNVPGVALRLIGTTLHGYIGIAIAVGGWMIACRTSNNTNTPPRENQYKAFKGSLATVALYYLKKLVVRA